MDKFPKYRTLKRRTYFAPLFRTFSFLYVMSD